MHKPVVGLGLGLGARSGSIWWMAGLVVGMQSKRVLLTAQFKKCIAPVESAAVQDTT